MKIKALTGAVVALALGLGGLAFAGPALATETACVPKDAYTKTIIDSPAVLAVAAIPEVTELSHTEYQRYSWKGGPSDPKPVVDPPSGIWQANTENYAGAGHDKDPIGVAFAQNNQGLGDWFFWTGTKVIDRAYVRDTSAVVAVAAITHDVLQAAVVCEPPVVIPPVETPPATTAAPLLCLPSSALSYTYNPADNTGTVTVADAPGSTGKLCDPVYITAASWNYTSTTLFPQTLNSLLTQYVRVEAVGEYNFGAVVTCGQGDIYASNSDYIVPSATLGTASNWERFLNTFGFATTTPGYTYMTTSHECMENPTLPLIDPTPVTFTDTCGVEGDRVIIPALTSEDQTYSTSDITSKSGVRTVTVTAIPSAGYGFSSAAVTSWSHTFKTDAQNNCVTVSGDPEAVDQTCAVSSEGAVSGYLTVAAVTGVVYTIHPLTPGGADTIVVGSKTNVVPGDYLVMAAAEPGFILSGVTQWKRTVANNAVDCSLPILAFLQSSVNWVSQTCSTSGPVSGYISIDPTDFLSYFVGNTQLTSARTAFAPGTYVVTVTAPPGDTVDGPSSYTAIITKATTSCGNLDPQSLTTLAFTGFDSGAGYLAVASALLLLGAALVFGARRAAKS